MKRALYTQDKLTNKSARYGMRARFLILLLSASAFSLSYAKTNDSTTNKINKTNKTNTVKKSTSAQTHDNSRKSANPNTDYRLPKLRLNTEILTYQIISDLALNRNDTKTAYQGYMHLAKKTNDPRYAERAVWTAYLMNDSASIAEAQTIFKRLAPNTTLDTPQTSTVGLVRVAVLVEQEKWPAAFDEANRFVKEHPENEIGWSFVANTAARIKKTEAQLEAYERLAQLRPNDADTLNNLAFTLAKTSTDLPRAEQLVTKALSVNPLAPHILDTAGFVAYRLQKLPQALNFAKKAYSASPILENGLHLAEILWANGQIAQAKGLLQKIIQSTPNPTAEQQQQIQQLQDLFAR